jgi:hypothetical protein
MTYIVNESLYSRAVGYNYEAVKVFMPANRTQPVYAKYIEHVPPVTAGIFWLKNRDPQQWRDSQQLEHVLGKYIISDKPMTEEQWARERATVIDVEPEQNLPSSDKGDRDAASPSLPQISTVGTNKATSNTYAEIPAVQQSAIMNRTASFVLCAGNATASRDRSGLST